MAEEDDLGRIYGVQLRDFADTDTSNAGWGKDQLKDLVKTLKNDPNSRRMYVSYWNPLASYEMALVPCHTSFNVSVLDGKLHLSWYQRSVDLCCNQTITTYALLLHLLAKEAGLQEGILTGFLNDIHAYEPHIEGLKQQLSQKTHKLPIIQTPKFSSIFDWEFGDTVLENYEYSESIKYEVVV